MVRPGLRPCRCDEAPVHRLATKRELSHLPRTFVQTPAFDPWGNDVNCMLVGDIYPYPKKIEDGVEDQRRRLDDMLAKGQMAADEHRFWLGRLAR